MSLETDLTTIKTLAENAVSTGKIPNVDDQYNIVNACEYLLWCLDSTGTQFDNVQPKPTGVVRPSGWRP